MLDKDSLKSKLKTIFETEGNDAESVAAAMADAFDSYVKTAKVTVTAPTGARAACILRMRWNLPSCWKRPALI